MQTMMVVGRLVSSTRWVRVRLLLKVEHSGYLARMPMMLCAWVVAVMKRSNIVAETARDSGRSSCIISGSFEGERM